MEMIYEGIQFWKRFKRRKRKWLKIKILIHNFLTLSTGLQSRMCSILMFPFCVLFISFKNYYVIFKVFPSGNHLDIFLGIICYPKQAQWFIALKSHATQINWKLDDHLTDKKPQNLQANLSVKAFLHLPILKKLQCKVKRHKKLLFILQCVCSFSLFPQLQEIDWIST